jgi:hypothetical protein
MTEGRGRERERRIEERIGEVSTKLIAWYFYDISRNQACAIKSFSRTR